VKELEETLTNAGFDWDGVCWTFTDRSQKILTAKEESNSIRIENTQYRVFRIIPHPRSPMTEKRIIRATHALVEKVRSCIHQERKAKKVAKKIQALSVPLSPTAPVEPCYGDLRNYQPLQYCETCHEMKREDLMKTEEQCLGCAGE
jgi:hypothetical protein